MKSLTVLLLILVGLGHAYIAQPRMLIKEIGDLDSETHTSLEWRPERGTDTPMADEERGHQGREVLPCKSMKETTSKKEMVNASSPEESFLHLRGKKEESVQEAEDKRDALFTEEKIKETTLDKEGLTPVTDSEKSLGSEGLVTEMKADHGIPPETEKTESTEGQKRKEDGVETNTEEDVNGSIENTSDNNRTNSREEKEDLIPGITIDNRVNNDTMAWAIAEKSIPEETEEDEEVPLIYAEVEMGEEDGRSEEEGRIQVVGDGLQRPRGEESRGEREKAQPEEHKAVAEEQEEIANNKEEEDGEREEEVVEGEEDATNRTENEKQHFGELLLTSTAPPPVEKKMESLSLGQVANQYPTPNPGHSISQTTMEPTTEASMGAASLTQAPPEEETEAVSLVELQLVEVLNVTDSSILYLEEKNSSVSMGMEVRGQAGPFAKISVSSENKDVTVKDTIKEKKTSAKKLKSVIKPNHSHDELPTIKPEEDQPISKVQQTKTKSLKPKPQSKEVKTTPKPKESMTSTKSINSTAKVHQPNTTPEPKVSQPTSRPILSEPSSKEKQQEESTTITFQPAEISIRIESTEKTTEANPTPKSQQSEQQMNKAQPELQITKPTSEQQLTTPKPLTPKVQLSPKPTPKGKMYAPAFNPTQAFTSPKPPTKTTPKPNTTKPITKPLRTKLIPNLTTRKPTLKPEQSKLTPKSQLTPPLPATTSILLMPLPPTKPTLNPFPTTPTVKPVKTQPTLKSKPTLKPRIYELSPKTTSKPIMVLPTTPTATLKPLTSAPTLKPLITKPTLKSLITTPTLKPLISTPTLKPLITKHLLKPLLNKPTVKPLKTKPTLKPLKPKLMLKSQIYELSPKTTSKPIIVLSTTPKPANKPLPSKLTLKPLLTKPTLNPLITKPLPKPLIPKPTLKPLTSKPTQQRQHIPKSKLFELSLETTSKPIMSGAIYKLTLKSLPTKPTFKPILIKPTLKPLLAKPLTTKPKPRTHITESASKRHFNQSSAKPKHITLTPLPTKPTSRSEQTQPTPKTALLKPAMKTAQSSRYKKNKQLMKKKKMKKTSQVFKNEGPTASTKPTSAYFPYFKDNHCPSECACYGKVVQCSDKGMDKIPYGIPYNSRYILLMNNQITTVQLDLLGGYSSMEFLVLSSNQLTDSSIEGAFEGVQALKRLYLDRNLLESVPGDLPGSLEELRLDNNHLSVMSEAAWARCPGLLVLSLRNNSLGNGLESLPTGVLSPLGQLRTLSLDHNQLVSVPLGLPLSIKELYLRGNLIRRFRCGAFTGTSELMVLDLSGNRLTNKGLLRESLLNTTHLESLNLEGNRFKHVPRHLPPSLKTLNLEGNRISAVSKDAFLGLSMLEHLGLSWNRISRVAPGAFKLLPVLHQLDLCHNALRQVPRQLPAGLHSAALTHNRIESVPRDAFCWAGSTPGLSSLVLVQLEHNLIDLGNIDTQAFKCLRGFQVVHLY